MTVTQDQVSTILDGRGRPLRSLRLSVTDRCNLRCSYCMPEENYAWLPRKDILSLEELARLARMFAKFGTSRIRITGGEPLLRRNLPELVRMLSAISGIEDLAMTTNATRLSEYAFELRAAGLQRVTVSLDTLNEATFAKLARRRALKDCLAGIHAAATAEFKSLKLNMVVLRDTNVLEIPDMLRFAASVGAQVRFIEYMDVGGANLWSRENVVSRAEILEIIEHDFGPVREQPTSNHAPAKRFTIGNGQSFGIIASTTQPFCDTCDRSRVTADGVWYHCLYAASGHNLRELLRQASHSEILEQAIQSKWSARLDQGAHDRLSNQERGPLIPLSQLKKNPRLEMHTRGG